MSGWELCQTYRTEQDARAAALTWEIQCPNYRARAVAQSVRIGWRVEILKVRFQ